MHVDTQHGRYSIRRRNGHYVASGPHGVIEISSVMNWALYRYFCCSPTSRTVLRALKIADERRG